MSFARLKERLPAFAPKDVRLNLSSLLQEDSFSERQRLGLSLACAIASRNADLVAAAEAEASTLDGPARDAARTAAALTAMNNVYYRFIHLVSDSTYRGLPAKLRMNVIADPGVPKTDFELWSLAVSALNGCGACTDAHERALREAGVPTTVVQAAVRCAAILQSVALALEPGPGGDPV